MAKNKKGKGSVDNFENLEEVLSKTEQYIEKNQKKLTNIAFAIILVAVGVFAYQKYYKSPLEKNAQEEVFQAQRYFERDSFRLALDGDGDENYLGFLDIADEYGSTAVGNLANYYAGISYLRLGQFEDAIYHLKNFSSEDFLLSALAKAATGDAYMELGDSKEAASKYMEASSFNTNDFTTPIYLQKAGLAYETLGDYKKALAAYETIEKDFANSVQARDIEKYITRAKFMMANP